MVGPDYVICVIKVGDHEVDELCAEVIRRSKLDGQRDLSEEY